MRRKQLLLVDVVSICGAPGNVLLRNQELIKVLLSGHDWLERVAGHESLLFLPDYIPKNIFGAANDFRILKVEKVLDLVSEYAQRVLRVVEELLIRQSDQFVGVVPVLVPKLLNLLTDAAETKPATQLAVQ